MVKFHESPSLLNMCPENPASAVSVSGLMVCVCATASVISWKTKTSPPLISSGPPTIPEATTHLQVILWADSSPGLPYQPHRSKALVFQIETIEIDSNWIRWRHGQGHTRNLSANIWSVQMIHKKIIKDKGQNCT